MTKDDYSNLDDLALVKAFQKARADASKANATEKAMQAEVEKRMKVRYTSGKRKGQMKRGIYTLGNDKIWVKLDYKNQTQTRTDNAQIHIDYKVDLTKYRKENPKRDYSFWKTA